MNFCGPYFTVGLLNVKVELVSFHLTFFPGCPINLGDTINISLTSFLIYGPSTKSTGKTRIFRLGFCNIKGKKIRFGNYIMLSGKPLLYQCRSDDYFPTFCLLLAKLGYTRKLKRKIAPIDDTSNTY